MDKIIILTGSGFTHNWGTPLGAHMWNFILNSKYLDIYPEIKSRYVMYENNYEYNYETLYYKILQDPKIPRDSKIGKIRKNKDAVEAYRNAVIDVYENYIERLLTVHNVNNFPNIMNCTRFLKDCYFDNNKTVYMFTLNQDMFIERHTDCYTPGCQANKISYAVYNESMHKIIMPDKIDGSTLWQEGKGSFNYIKLHGSVNWFDKTGKRLMILGGEKERQQSDFPLFVEYMRKFKEVLKIKGIKILIIGYGFMDYNINIVISEAIDNGCKIYLISPESPQVLWNKIEKYQDKSNSFGDGRSKALLLKLFFNIWHWYPFSLNQLFPSQCTHPIELIKLKEDLER